VIPFAEVELKQPSTNARVFSGNRVLDDMMGGGFFRDSIILVSGATGCGKTLLTTEYVAGGVKEGERCLLLAYEESREQLLRNADVWGQDFLELEQAGKLNIVASYPENRSLEDHLIAIKKHIDQFKPNRVAVDSLSALERASNLKGYREFVLSLTAFLKQQGITGLFTSTSKTLMGGESVSEAHISSIADTIVLLRYVEMFGEMRRGLAVLKMRGSAHDKQIREYIIEGAGMHIQNPFRNVAGILAGHARHISEGELERMGDLFKYETH